MIRDLSRQGLSISEIARRVGCDRKTVRKHLANPDQPRYSPRPPRESKLEPFKPYLQERFARGVFNCSVLYRELRNRGYTGKTTILCDYVQPYRKTGQQIATVRFETPPGKQAQVDWGNFGTIYHEGRNRRLYCFALTLGYSRVLYAEFTVSCGMMAFLRCHINAFAYLGGVPEELLHDNQKTVVHAHDMDGAHLWNARYLDFADYYGFFPRLCRPYRAQTKGKIESSIKYIRRNFWPSCPDVPGLGGLNEQLWTWLSEVANVRLHGTTHEVPMERLSHEGLRAVADRPAYDLSEVGVRKSSKDCFISYGGNRYSVPASHALSRLTVRELEDGHLEVYAGLSCIARHALVAGRHQTVIEPSHFEALWKAIGQPDQNERLVMPGPRIGQEITEPQVEVRALEVYQALADGEVIP